MEATKRKQYYCRWKIRHVSFVWWEKDLDAKLTIFLQAAAPGHELKFFCVGQKRVSFSTAVTCCKGVYLECFFHTLKVL